MMQLQVTPVVVVAAAMVQLQQELRDAIAMVQLHPTTNK